MSDMNGKVVLITGASSGIGRATAEVFAARGAKVVLAARREDELAALTSEIAERGGAASLVVTDVAIARDVERMVAHGFCRRPGVYRNHQCDHKRHGQNDQDLQNREQRIAYRILRRLER